MSRPMLHPARLLALALALFSAYAMLLGGASDARADTAAAQALFDAAKQLMTQGKYAEACPKLEESQRLDPGIGTQFNLATCYEQVGRTASAWSTFLEVAGSAKAAGQADREKVARQRANALEPKLARLTITAPASAPADLQVKRDGVAVGKAQWGTPVPIDPGKHTIEASATGRRSFTKTVEISKPGASETVAVPELEPGPPPPAPSPYYGVGAPATGFAAPAPPMVPLPGPKTKRRSGGLMATGIVLLSLGALTGAIGGLVVAACGDGGCDESSTDYNYETGEFETTTTSNDEALNVGYGLLIGGLVGIGGGIPLIVYGAKKVPVKPEEKKASSAPELLVGPRFTGLRWSM